MLPAAPFHCFDYLLAHTVEGPLWVCCFSSALFDDRDTEIAAQLLVQSGIAMSELVWMGKCNSRCTRLRVCNGLALPAALGAFEKLQV